MIYSDIPIPLSSHKPTSTSAKFLWKRIPPEIKDADQELSLIWLVGKLLWKKNYSEIYPAINSCSSWPNHLKNIMNLISESTRQRVIALISRAYSSIRLAEASNLLGLSSNETKELALKHDWTYDEPSGFLIIKQRDTKNSIGKDNQVILGLDRSTELLDKLGDYIVFLENANR